MIEVGAKYLLIVASFWSFAGINHLFKSVLTGAGDAMAAIYCNIAEMGTRLLLAFVLSRTMGYVGVFIAAPCGWFASSMMGVLIYWRGKWKEKGVVKRVNAS
jgi:Na+-driven multidrug efflux pump